MREDEAGIVEDRFEDPIKHQPTGLSVLHMISDVTTLKVLNQSVTFVRISTRMNNGIYLYQKIYTNECPNIFVSKI